MGQLTVLTNGMASYDSRFTAASGAATRAGLLIDVRFVSFDRIDDGSQALAAWLRSEGCIGFKYDFSPGLADDYDQSD